MSVHRLTGVADTTRAPKEYWDKRCAENWDKAYHGHYMDDPAFIKKMDDVNLEVILGLLNKFADKVPAGEAVKVLECACGTGRYSEVILPTYCDRYVGIDFADLNIQEAKRRFESDKASFHLSDMLSFKTSERFHLIFMVAAWSSIEQSSAEIITHLKTLLAPGGAIAVFEQDQYLVIWG